MCFTLCYFIKFSQDNLYFLIEILNDLVRIEEQKSSYDKFLIKGQNNQEDDKLQEIYSKLKKMLDRINSYPEIPKANKQIFKL